MSRLTAVVATGFIGLYLFVAMSRITYPYELEWMEGGSLEQTARLLAGQPLYVKPSLDFIPYIYTPGYFYAAAAASWIGGGGFTPLRLVSLLASLCCFALIFLLVRYESRSATAGVIAAGLFAATFRLGGAWFDLARVDSLFMALLLGGVLALRVRPTTGGSIVAAVLFFLSFMTKQPALIVAAVMAIGGLSLAQGRRWLIFPAVFGLLVVLAVGAFDAATGGWFTFYTLRLPVQHEIEGTAYLGFWSYDLKRPLAIAVMLTGVFVYRLAARRARELGFYTALFVGLLAIAWLSRLHSGGYDNVLMPLHAALAIGAGLAVASLRGTWLEPVACLACILQFAWLAYPPAPLIPTQRDREAGDRLVAMIAKAPGDVYVPWHGYLARRAAKRSFTGGMALADVQRGRDKALAQEVEAEVRRALSERRFGTLLLDVPAGDFGDVIDSGYTHQRTLFDDEQTFMPKTGLPTRPQELYVLRNGG